MTQDNKPMRVGGQAVIEGVMMNSPVGTATAVRRTDGSIVIKRGTYKSIVKRLHVGNVPVIRGALAFVDSLINGIQTLMDSADVALDDAAEEDHAQRGKSGKPKKQGDNTTVLYITMIIALAIGIGVFILLPNYVAAAIPWLRDNTALRSITEGILRLLFFFCYILAITRMKDIQRVFMYHGAEHKTIYCYEKGLPLTVNNVRIQSRLHPRCGTGFLLIVMMISIVVFFFIPSTDVLSRTVYRLALLPVVAGLSYEVIRLAGNGTSRIIRIISAPGMWLQNFTTREPDDSQIEVAITSLRASLGEIEAGIIAPAPQTEGNADV